MEQAIPQPKQGLTLKKLVLIIGGLILLAWAAIMAISLQNVESIQLQGSKVDPCFGGSRRTWTPYWLTK